MIVTRYVNGVKISDEDFYKLKVSNPIIDRICRSVVRRVKQEAESSRHGENSMRI